MVAGYKATHDSFWVGKPRLWSDKQMAGTGALPSFDLAPDGKRLVVLQSAEPERQGSVHVAFLLNFFDELKRRAPPTGRSAANVPPLRGVTKLRHWPDPTASTIRAH